ncbi:MAG: N-acetylmuramoyl-L-alanine amidase [Rhodobacterales bacterium 17-64-5]|nr:MAG: N-acetylmuramoyl-L-alanine amidase [Rhodobacterales bacterium 17-64-5]
MTTTPPWPSPNYGDRRGGVLPSLIVIHYTAMASCAEARARLCDPAFEVSAHWLVSETGVTEALVPEAMRAWHAGAGEWAGITDVNSHSIGIELANTGRQPFAEPQMVALEVLLAGIMARWDIPAHRVIGHSDMAPMRKRDPGARFDWRRLALAGLSVWPENVEPDAALDQMDVFMLNAKRFGYPPEASPLFVIDAFRKRFRPAYTKGRASADAPIGMDGAMMANLAARFPVDVADSEG